MKREKVMYLVYAASNAGFCAVGGCWFRNDPVLGLLLICLGICAGQLMSLTGWESAYLDKPIPSLPRSEQ